MTLYNPWMLLVVVPALLCWGGLYLASLLLTQRGSLRSVVALRYPLTGALGSLRPSWAQRARPWVQALRLLCMALLSVALLRPQRLQPGQKIWARGVDVMLAVDTSGSMQALDLDTERPIAQRRTRLQVVKDVIAQFIERRPNDQLGLVAFGTDAFTQCPLTLDHEIIDLLLGRMTIGMAGETTAIGSGIVAGLNRLRRSAARSKVLILLTDGSNNAGTVSPKRAADLAKAVGIRVYTIGAANRGPAPILQDSLFGKTVQYIEADLDEKTLRDIAQTTGGRYFRAADSQALARTYAEIDALEKSDLHRPAPQRRDECFAPFAVGALLCLVVEVALLRSRLQKVP